MNGMKGARQAQVICERRQHKISSSSSSAQDCLLFKQLGMKHHCQRKVNSYKTTGYKHMPMLLKLQCLILTFYAAQGMIY